MISTARVPADKPVRIAFSLDNASDFRLNEQTSARVMNGTVACAGVAVVDKEGIRNEWLMDLHSQSAPSEWHQGWGNSVFLERLGGNDTPPEDPIPLVCSELDQQLQNVSRTECLVTDCDARKWTDLFSLLFVKPLPPCHDSLESMQVFKQHCQIAEEYHEVKKEIALLEERKKELIAKLDQAEKEKVDAAQLAREFEALMEENRALKLAQSQCVEQLEKLRIQYQKRQGSS
ncbi:hypothetical protein MC885_005243 [Smutsia gigantea]|nr:hypothetical protein MC885_005243 [Smutsia gigantea]